MCMLKWGWWVTLKVYEQGSDQSVSYSCNALLICEMHWSNMFLSSANALIWPMHFSYVKCTYCTKNKLFIWECSSDTRRALLIWVMHLSAEKSTFHTGNNRLSYLNYQHLSWEMQWPDKCISHHWHALLVWGIKLLIWPMHFPSEKCTSDKNTAHWSNTLLIWVTSLLSGVSSSILWNAPMWQNILLWVTHLSKVWYFLCRLSTFKWEKYLLYE